MDLLRLEQQRAEIIAVLNESLSVRKRIFLLSEFIFTLSEFETVQIRETYFKEFYPYFISVISSYEPFGVHPDLTKKVIDAAKVLFDHSKQSEDTDELVKQITRVSSQNKLLLDVLTNKTQETGLSERYLFPVLEEDEGENKYGLVDSISVTITKSDKLSFAIVPSEKQIESKIKQQVETSWEVALVYLNRYKIKSRGNEQVVIHLNKRLGNYRGDSLGTVLSLAFIKAILLYYNSSVEINVKNGVAFTGKMDEQGKVYPVTEDIIKEKVNTVFYSPVGRFVVAETEKEIAEETIATLNKDFPDRDLKIIGTDNLDELLNRRDAVDIKKRNILKRFARSEVKNYTIAVLLIGLLVLLYFSGLWDWDTNPTKLLHKGRYLYVMNKNEKVLWKKFLFYDANTNEGGGQLRISAKLVDIDLDGTNEVITANEADTSKNNYGDCLNKIFCYDSEGKVIWTYKFQDEVQTISKDFSTNYFPNLIEVNNENDKQILYCFAYHETYYPGVIYKLDCKTGERVEGTFWHPGRINDAYLGDFNEDGNIEIVALGVHNGFEKDVIFSINLKDLKGTAPSTPNYTYLGKEITSFNKYILLPLTDLAYYHNFRYGMIQVGSLHNFPGSKVFQFDSEQGTGYTNSPSILYKFDHKLNLVDIDCSDAMQTIRDSLVVNGKLNKPYTNTPEYFNSIKDDIRYWDGEKFTRH